MDKLTKEYQFLKEVVARAYGVTLDENGNGNREQTNTMEPSFTMLLEFQNLFNDFSLYYLFCVEDNMNIVRSCYDNLTVGNLYNRIATLYLINKSHNPTNIPLNKIIDDEIDTLYKSYMSIREITSKQYKMDIYPSVTNDPFHFNDVKTPINQMDHDNPRLKIIYILNIYLVLFIRQIHDELFGVNTIENYINRKKSPNGNQ